MRRLDIEMFLRIFAGLFLAALAVLELNAQHTFLPGVFRGITLPFGPDAGVLNTLGSLIELAGGAALIAEPFHRLRRQVYRILLLAVLVVWIGRMAYFYVFSGLISLDFLIWVKEFSYEAVFAIVLWRLYRIESA